MTTIYGTDDSLINVFQHKKPAMFVGFNQFGDFIDFVETIPKGINGSTIAWTNEVGNNWHGTPTMANAIELARNGWHEASDLAPRVLDLIHKEIKIKPKRQYSVAGSNISVGRLLSGNPVHMRKRIRQEKDKAITIFTEYDAASTISSETLLIRAACVAAIVDTLEADGYTCEVVATCYGKFGNGSPGYQFAIKLKRIGETLNIMDIAFGLGHPSMLRRFTFAAIANDIGCKPLHLGMGRIDDSLNPKKMPKNSYFIQQVWPGLEYLLTGVSFEEKVRQVFSLVISKEFPIDLALSSEYVA